MISPISWFILALTIAVVSPTYDPRCKRLSNGCEIKFYYCDTTRCYLYLCDKVDLNFQFSQPEMELLKNCSFNKEVNRALNNVYFRLTKASFLDSTFDLLNNKLFFNSTVETDDILYFVIYQSYTRICHKITFRYIKGFDSGTFKEVNLIDVEFNLFQMDFYYSNFDFYSNRSLIRSCDDLDPLNIPKYVFSSFSNKNLVIRFINSEYKTKTCPLLFLNYNIEAIEFNGIQNTFYKTNFPSFFSISNSSFIKSKICYLYIINMQNIELNSVILNHFLFSDITELRIYGDIVSIEKGLFKSFKNLKAIELDILPMRKLFHRGIDWVFGLNADTNVDINNLSPFEDSYELCAQFFINGISNDKRTISNLDFNFIDYFPDEDFCLYAQFPFQQLIFVNFFGVDSKCKDYSCTYLWFYQHFKKLRDFCTSDIINFINSYPIPEVDKEKIDKCNFKQRLIKCNRSQYETPNKTSNIASYYDVKRTIDLIHLILILAMPIVCLLGIVSNSLVIYTVSHKSNQKDLKENQYKYMRLNAIFNILILLIQPLTLISECRDYNSLFCSSIRFWQFSQYFKIIFGEYFSNVFRLAANLTYIQFALNRLSLIGKNHGRIVTDASKLKIGQYICRIVIPCLVLPVVKVFRFFPNSYRIALDYPVPIGYYSQFINHSLMFVYMSFNVLFDFLNNFFFLIVNLIIDVNLAIKMKQTIDEKKKNKATSDNKKK